LQIKSIEFRRISGKDKSQVKHQKNNAPILIADDDDDDYLLTRDALLENHLYNKLFRVKNGEEIMDYLRNRGAFISSEDAPRPSIIILDLNMPKKDGRTALAEIKECQDLRRIPVVVMTASRAEEDIRRSYDLGANTYIRKPDNYTEMVKLFAILKSYWFEASELP